MKKTFCDKCKRECVGVMSMTTKCSFENPSHRYTLDLCIDCYESVTVFISGNHRIQT